jgi:hypothetical protein
VDNNNSSDNAISGDNVANTNNVTIDMISDSNIMHHNTANANTTAMDHMHIAHTTNGAINMPAAVPAKVSTVLHPLSTTMHSAAAFENQQQHATSNGISSNNNSMKMSNSQKRYSTRTQVSDSY